MVHGIYAADAQRLRVAGSPDDALLRRAIRLSVASSPRSGEEEPQTPRFAHPADHDTRKLLIILGAHLVQCCCCSFDTQKNPARPD